MHKFKMFVKKNQDIIVGSSLVVSSVALSVVLIKLTGTVIDQNSVDSADVYTRDDGTSVINVFLKNGHAVALVKQ
jgi:RPA family protein